MRYFSAEGEEKQGVDNPLEHCQLHPQAVKDYIVALRANARQWSANTKTRGEVNHTTKKPYKQKGTGNARQGSLVAPQYKGGGRVFGPRPKYDVKKKVNQKEKRGALLTILGEKILAEKVTCVDEPMFLRLKPRTKEVVSLLERMKISPKGVLFVGRAQDDSVDYSNFKLSVRNLERSLFVTVNTLNGYDVAASRHVVITKEALAEIVALTPARKG